MGREGGFAAAGVVVFSWVALETVVVDASCEAALPGRFLLEEESAEAKAGAMTRGEETVEEEEP